MIAGLEQPTSGDVLLDDQVITGLPPRARNMAMVFQSYALYPHLNVFRNIAFPLHAQKMARGAIQEKVDWAAKMRSEEHTSELQSLMRISYAVFCLTQNT